MMKRRSFFRVLAALAVAPLAGAAAAVFPEKKPILMVPFHPRWKNYTAVYTHIDPTKLILRIKAASAKMDWSPPLTS